MQRLKHWLQAQSWRPVALAVLALIGLCALAYWNQLGTLGLMDKTEGLFVEVPRQMLERGDWVTPRWNGDTFFDYPVWGYWMVALSFRVFGISEWAARLPVALAASATVLALFAVVLLLAPAAEPQQRSLGRATLCATVLALSPGWLGWGRSSVTDMFLSSAITLALLGFALAHLAVDQPLLRRLGTVAMPLFAGVAVLAKGPVGVLLPGLVIALFLLLKGRGVGLLAALPWWPMLALFLGVTVPWYAAATAANGGTFLGRFLGFSNLERFTSVIYDHPGPPWYYLPWLLLLLLPWSLYLPAAISRLRFWRWSSWTPEPSSDDLSRLALLWLVVIVAFFSAAATKLPGYILPALPGGALLVGLLFQPMAAADALPRPGVGLRITGWLNCIVLAVLSAGALVAPRLLSSDPAFPAFADAVQRSALPWLLALPFAAASLTLLVLLLRRSGSGLAVLWLPNAAAWAAVLALVVPPFAPLFDRERLLPVRILAQAAAQQAEVHEPLLVVGYKRYSVVFYSGRPVLFVSNPKRVIDRLRRQQGSDGRLPQSVLVLGSDAELLEFGLGPGDGTLLRRHDAHRLMRVPSQRLQALAIQG